MKNKPKMKIQLKQIPDPKFGDLIRDMKTDYIITKVKINEGVFTTTITPLFKNKLLRFLQIKWVYFKKRIDDKFYNKK